MAAHCKKARVDKIKIVPTGAIYNQLKVQKHCVVKVTPTTPVSHTQVTFCHEYAVQFH